MALKALAGIGISLWHRLFHHVVSSRRGTDLQDEPLANDFVRLAHDGTKEFIAEWNLTDVPRPTDQELAQYTHQDIHATLTKLKQDTWLSDHPDISNWLHALDARILLTENRLAELEKKLIDKGVVESKYAPLEVKFTEIPIPPRPEEPSPPQAPMTPSSSASLPPAESKWPGAKKSALRSANKTLRPPSKP